MKALENGKFKGKKNKKVVCLGERLTKQNGKETAGMERCNKREEGQIDKTLRWVDRDRQTNRRLERETQTDRKANGHKQ